MFFSIDVLSGKWILGVEVWIVGECSLCKVENTPKA